MPDEMEENGQISDHCSENEDESESYTKEDGKMVENSIVATGEAKKKYDPKDPLRPRRKKARRACYACQRAHLTCGDERPCKRCIKRGLADACQDGVRKKAKYLHDAPEEALGPVLGPNYNNTNTNAARSRPNGQRHNSTQSDMSSNTHGNSFLTQSSATTFPLYPSGGRGQVGMPEGISFNPQTSPVSPSFQGNPSTNAPTQVDGMLQANPLEYNALFDPSNPALYNFDLEGLNFGSQYAGWEFGILNKMALGAETPPRENSISQTPTTETNYAAIFGNGANGPYDASSLLGVDYVGIDNGASIYSQGNLQHGLPHAYAIAAGPTGLASPSTETTASPQATLDGSPNTGTFGQLPNVSGASRIKSKQDKIAQSILSKRQHDSAAVYASVKEPYPYTAGFHNMLAVLQDRLPVDKLVSIARSLAEIRPSFMACTKDLTREDLVFMEKCFQRTRVEYDDFLLHCCAPTIVCRRSGEVVAVNKEFTALTGWTKDVLLGKEPNRNLHVRSSNNGSAHGGDGGSRTGTSTPRMQSAKMDTASNWPQPVFLADLLDDDSVVQFYRDFAQLAFEDSRGKVQRNCSLMKYRAQEESDGKDDAARKDARTSILSNRVTRIDGEHGISRIEKDGKVNCTYCCTIKRDVFDIPMMIIMNASF
ncbi:Transcription activator [Hirsutella minnesotensis 3608]|nr:Transcription activator [Hirsutella minnesotensis 3608]